MKIHLATDHAGYERKEQIKYFLVEKGFAVVDHGAFQENPQDDYPDFIKRAAKAVSRNPKDRAIIFGGSGQGEDIVADKYRNIRSVVYYGYNLDIIKLSREHNNSNVLSLGARFLDEYLAKEAVELWLETPFSYQPRHVRRLKKLQLIEGSSSSDQAIEIAAWFGVFLIIIAYALNLLGQLSASNHWYSVMNGVGSLLVLIDAWKDRNYQPVLINVVWLGLAIFALWSMIIN